MEQFIVNIEPGADKTFLRKMIQNIKGVSEVILKKETDNLKPSKVSKKTDRKTEEWIKKMRYLSNSIDSSVIDMNDEKTRYLMSK